MLERIETKAIAANKLTPKIRIPLGIAVHLSISQATGQLGPFRADFSRMVRLAIGLCLICPLCYLMAEPTPLTIKDVSLMLRAGYSSEAVLQELSNRKFVDTLDPTSEKQLVQAGANQILIEALRSGAYQLSANEMAGAKGRIATRVRTASESSQDSTIADGLTKNEKAPPNPPQEQQVGGTIYDHLKDDLVYWHEGSLVHFDDETLEKKKFYLLFFSAIWSKEGRQFTSQLADYYNRVHPQHPEFEIVFFSADRSQFAMENYVSQTNMPWPCVAYDKLQGKAGALAGSLTNKIPRLILAEASGRVLSDSGETKPDFAKVLADLDSVLAGSN